MAATQRRRILEALMARLEVILVSRGFATDVGQQVIVGEIPQLGPSDPDAIVAIMVGEQPGNLGLNVFTQLPYEVLAIAKADLDKAWLTVEDVIGDVKRAIELEDRTLDGLVLDQLSRGPVKSLPREPGSTTIGASITYLADFKEGWGAP